VGENQRAVHKVSPGPSVGPPSTKQLDAAGLSESSTKTAEGIHDDITIGPLPEIDHAEVSEDRFFGRSGLVNDFLGYIRGLMHRSTRGKNTANLIWYYGFGGLGKSLLLRRCLIEAGKKYPSLRAGLIDWQIDKWRFPSGDHFYSAQDVLNPIAVRLTQLYGEDTMRQYWESRNGFRKYASLHAALEMRFECSATIRMSVSVNQDGACDRAWRA
jgi:hypothetical protein